MVSELSSVNKVVGAKQVRRALNDGRACKVFLACDADPRVVEPLARPGGTGPGGARRLHGRPGSRLRHRREKRRRRPGAVSCANSFGFNGIRLAFSVKIYYMPPMGQIFGKEENHAYF